MKEYSLVKEDILSRLKGLGLSGYAAKAFLTILQSQPISASSLCKLTGIPDSKIYYALKELEEKGLVIVQRGTPSVYRTLSISQILSSLQDGVEEVHRKRLDAIRGLERLLEPLAGISTGGDVELAYIIKGFRNIAEKMNEVVGEARKQIVLMTTSERLLNGLTDALKEARRRGVQVKLAVPTELLASKALIGLRPNGTLFCDCNILIGDEERLVTASKMDAEDSHAIVTQDEGMITMSREFYENPKCCTTIR